jgi:hypothetical protein
MAIRVRPSPTAAASVSGANQRPSSAANVVPFRCETLPMVDATPFLVAALHGSELAAMAGAASILVAALHHRAAVAMVAAAWLSVASLRRSAVVPIAGANDFFAAVPGSILSLRAASIGPGNHAALAYARLGLLGSPGPLASPLPGWPTGIWRIGVC